MNKLNFRFLKSSLFLFLFLYLFSEPIKAKEKILKIGAIPDQNQEILDKRFKTKINNRANLR